jgi:hypothetical protein
MQKVIGLVHTRLSPTGGVENYINKLVTSLLKKNWRIHYFTSRVSQSIPPGMTIHKVHVIRGTSVSRMLSFAYGAKKRRSDQNFRSSWGLAEPFTRIFIAMEAGVFWTIKNIPLNDSADCIL